MIEASVCAALSTALEKLKSIVEKNEKDGVATVIFCEDRLSLAAERTVCAAVEGTFLTSVNTFARFLAGECGAPADVLSAQGSAMVIRRIIENNKQNLKLFKRLSAADAAQSVYDTIALLYSSRISAEETFKASESGGLLGGKLHDVALIYSEYEKYLSECGKQDRNGYLKKLPAVIEKSQKIKGNYVIFLGFQALTCTIVECVRAAFKAAKNVYGLFLGGDSDIYVNETIASFTAAAKDFGGVKVNSETGTRCADAERLRVSLFNPDSFNSLPQNSGRVRIFEAADSDEELEFIAASIKKHVLDDGVRYAKISVMLPDLKDAERSLSRVFARYRIPYFADRQRSLAEHPLCAFILNYLSCALYGCLLKDVDGVISSPYFSAEKEQKDIFRNYALRLCNYRGGVKREPKEEILKNFGFDFSAVSAVREKFLTGLKFLTNCGKQGICGEIRQLLQYFEVDKKLKELAESFKNTRPAAAQFCLRAYNSVLNVLNEAETLLGDISLKEFVKILKSGFTAAEISIIPPKSDAVFVGDLATTANTGSDIVFAARLTGAVPESSADCALLTDREITALESVNLNISPKIRQVNARRRETIALNICAFREYLYLTYPVRLSGEEQGASEIISYAQAVFLTQNGTAKKAIELSKLEKTERVLPYYCSEKLPALRYLQKYSTEAAASSVYEVLTRSGFKEQADCAIEKRVKRDISCGERLYPTYGSISPTTLENYFSCPYYNFIQRGLRVKEREEGAVRAVDTGNFIHSVLQDLAEVAHEFADAGSFNAKAREVASEKLSRAPYSSLADTDSGKYTAESLVDEAVKISEGMYAQLKNSKFTVAGAETKCEITLPAGVKIFGRIDRVDQSGDMVRIIDYKTGNIDATAAKYYSGEKLQLPLYLKSVSSGKRAVGAYYFPAAIEYKKQQDGVFRLQGFMDGSDDVVSASDVKVQPKEKSEYVYAYLGGKKLEGALPSDDFAAFLDYSVLVASKGAEEMLGGNVAPSPAKGICDYCKAGGSCGFVLGRDGAERKNSSVKCAEIAALVKSLNGKDGGDGNG